jgi:thymidylate synthase
MEIHKTNAKDGWIAALQYLLNHAEKIKDAHGRMSFDVRGLKIEVEEGFDEPAKELASVSHWIYPSLDELQNAMLNTQDSQEYDYSYSRALFDFNGTNQIDGYVIPKLKASPATRQATCILWDPAKTKNTVLPGLIAIDFKLRKNKLFLTAFVRSQDIFFGWPANTYQLFVLQNYVKNALNCELGSITTFSTSAHFFEEQLEHIKKILGHD